MDLIGRYYLDLINALPVIRDYIYKITGGVDETMILRPNSYCHAILDTKFRNPFNIFLLKVDVKIKIQKDFNADKEIVFLL